MPSTHVLVLNAGSSTLKYAVVDPASGTTSLHGVVDRIGGPDVPDHTAALDTMQADLAEQGLEQSALLAIGHRVVHGGPHLIRATVVDDDVLAEIEHLARLAPLHNPPAAAGIRSAREHFPGVPQVAAFDTAFFADLPAAAATYAIDAEVAERQQIRRYGAHGISHQYVAGAVAEHLDRPLADLDQIVLHVGNGASAAAIRGGRPVETSMGLTPLEGLVMGTRAGDLDPGVVLHLLRHGELDADGLEDLLHHRSGLQGLAGHHDFRDLLAALDAGDERARTAYDVYCHRIRKYVGAYLAVLDGADVITFTAGVGEHNPRLREDALSGLDRLGVEIDPARNRARATGARRISTDTSRVVVLVVPTNEELAIAREAAALIASDAS
jgi:acetate kinase